VIIAEKPVQIEVDEQETPVKQVKVQEETFPEDWDKESLPKTSKKTRTSIVLSGVAGSNSSPRKTSKTMMRLPGTGNPLKNTTITDKGQSVYGISLSFGAGVKIDFAGCKIGEVTSKDKLIAKLGNPVDVYEYRIQEGDDQDWKKYETDTYRWAIDDEWTTMDYIEIEMNIHTGIIQEITIDHSGVID
jgi:hypothetical protein